MVRPDGERGCRIRLLGQLQALLRLGVGVRIEFGGGTEDDDA